MTELFTDALPDSITLRQTGGRATTYPERLGTELRTGLAGVGADIMLGHPEEAGTDPNTGQPIGGWEEQKWLSAEEANKKYPGTKFTSRVPDSTANDIYQRRQEELMRQSIIERSPDYWIPGAALGFATRMAPGFLDPLNIAASFVPGVSEARAALMASTALGRRAIVGFTRGAAGMLPLAPAQALIATHDQEDISGVNILANIITGGILGTGFHMLAGGKGDALAHAAPQAAADIARAPPGTAEAMVRASVAAVADGRLPDLEPLQAQIARAAAAARPEAVEGEPMVAVAGQRIPAATPLMGFARELEQQRGLAPLYRLLPPEPQRLADFLRAQGDIPPAEATRRAWDAGYLPGEEEPPVSALEEALARDRAGEPVYRDEDAMRVVAYRAAIEHNEEIDRLAAENGINPAGMTRSEFWHELARRLDSPELEAEIARQDAETDAAVAAAEARTPERPAAATMTEEAHAEHDQQTKIAAPEGAGARSTPRPDTLAVGEGPVEAGARPRGRGAGTGPGEAPKGEPRGAGAEPELDPTQAKRAEIEAQNAQLEREIRTAAPERAAEIDEAIRQADEIKQNADNWAKAAEQVGACPHVLW